MANFDFGNTPITSDITLKAGWCCENSAENDITSRFYDGEGARITLSDGKIVYITPGDYVNIQQSTSAFFAHTNPDFSDSGTTFVNTEDVISFEFGNGLKTGIQDNMFHYNYWKNLQKVTGRLDYVPRNFLFNGYIISPELLVELEITTTSNIGTGFIGSRGNAHGTIIFNCPESAFSSLMSFTDPQAVPTMLNVSSYTGPEALATVSKGFAIGGTAADYVLSNFPNSEKHRNLHKLE